MDTNDLLKNTKSASLRDRILLSPVTKYVLSTLVVGMLLLTGVYVVMLEVFNNIDDGWPATCDIRTSYQVECIPGQKVTYDTCSMVGCCWHDQTRKCFHSVPARHGYYYTKDTGVNHYKQGEALQPRRPYSPLGSSNWPSLYLHIINVDSEYVQIDLRTREETNERGKRSNVIRSNTDDVHQGLSVQINSPEFSITVTRANATKIPLLTTARGPLIVTETYWEWTLYLGRITLYALDSAIINGTTSWLYNNARSSKTPVFLGITIEGEAVACYLSYGGPMEIQILNESNLIILRGFSVPETIFLHVFASATPRQTVKRLFEALKNDGMITEMNDWPLASSTPSLGLHVCPMVKNIPGSTVVKSIKSLIDRTENDQVPWDNHCIYQEFYLSLDKALSDSEKEILAESQAILQKAGKSFVPHLTPMILTENSRLLLRLENSSLILKDSSGTYLGYCGELSVAYPEWSDNRILEEFQSYLSEYVDIFGPSKVVFIRDAWPRDDSSNASLLNFSQFDYMPQELQSLMSSGTIPLSLTSSILKSHYYAHNKYADKFRAFVRQKAYLLDSRDVLFSDANSVAEGVGWSALRAAIAHGVSSGLMGYLPPAMYVCGTSAIVSDELCTRWYGAAVVFPYIVAIPEYLPGGTWLSIGTSKYARNLLKLRASLITYQRTIINEYYNFGLPALAPTHFHYPLEPFISRARSNQFLWGQSLLVGLVTLPKMRQIHMQIPGGLPWRHLNGGAEIAATVNGKSVSIPAMEGEIVILVRPGHVIPMHENVATTAVETAQSDIQLFVNWACNTNVKCLAHGRIGYESGVFLNVIINETSLTLENVSNVRSRACSAPNHQSTLIKSLNVLGGISYNVSVDLCVGEDDIIEKKLIN